ncbi:MAG: response regulator transcription factor [Chloroflexi bacterium]|nr:response regulator transcription factor [Chloroflexota bacterium]
MQFFVVADDPLARVGLAVLLADVADCQVIDQIHSDEIDDALDNIEPDVIVWDVGWQTAVSLPDWRDYYIPVIALLADESEAAAVWATGVTALLNRQVDGEKLAAVAGTAVHNLVILDPNLSQSLLLPAITAPPLDDELTPRELDVLQLLAEGISNKAIAQRLKISSHTVKFHVNAIMSKLAAQSRTEAVVRATRLGLISL